MIRTYIASFRIAVALVCVGLSLILGAQWFGFIPDAAAIQVRARGTQCEAIAINAAAMVRQQKWHELQAVLSAIVERDEDLLSVGVRSDAGQLRLQTAGHETYWAPDTAPAQNISVADRQLPDNRLPEAPVAAEQVAANLIPVAQVQIPIQLHGQPWGRMELCYQHQSSGAALLHHPLAQLLGFFSIAGLCAYTFLTARMMGLLNSTQVVPDRVRNALDTLAEGLLVLDERHQIVLANQAFSETVRIDSQQLTGRIVSELPWVADDGAGALDYPWTRETAQTESQSDQRLRYQLEDGRQRIFSINSTPLAATAGGSRGMLATFRDITHIEEHRSELENMLTMLKTSRDEISRKNHALEILATQDSLTGCLNRRAFFERFDLAWKEAQEQQSPLSCIMIDNDHFKSVNDTYGHHVGDEVLRQVSALLRKHHEDTDLVCRFGGEEFCILLRGRTLDEAQQAAERLRQAIEQLRFESPAELVTTASIGVAEISQGAANPQEMINQADECLYVAKRQGRNRVIVYQPGFDHSEAEDAAPEERGAAHPSALSNGPATLTPQQSSARHQTVAALLTALAHRDTDTAEHSCRVALLCMRCAEGLLEPSQIEVLGLAAQLHDIGKIGIPDRILLKPGPLTPGEWELMEQHDQIGVEIVSKAFDCSEMSEIIRTHHAFFDGKARTADLPDGEEIPVGARILTICDSYDAMTSDRPYRKGRSHEEAVEELRRCAGTQFDPRIVEHFVQAIGPDTSSPWSTLLSTSTELLELCQSTAQGSGLTAATANAIV